jgi:hypothetical protein
MSKRPFRWTISRLLAVICAVAFLVWGSLLASALMVGIRYVTVSMPPNQLIIGLKVDQALRDAARVLARGASKRQPERADTRTR